MSVLITEYVTLVNDASKKLDALTDEVANIENANVELTRKLNEANELIEKRNTELVEMQARVGFEYMLRKEAQNELLVIRRSWWPIFADEIKKPEYLTFIQAKDAKGLFQYLTAENVEFDLDPIPAPIVRGSIAGLLAELALRTDLEAETKTTWRGVLLDQVATLGDNAKEVPAALVQGLVARAINAKILPPDAKIGVVLTSRLKLLGYADRIKSPIDIIEAMEWGPKPPAPAPENPTPEPIPEPTP